MNHLVVAPIVLTALVAGLQVLSFRHHIVLQRVFSVAGTVLLLAKSEMLFWIAGLTIGIFVGPVQAASRSYMARVAPPDMTNQMFGLFAFSGKATAFLGPLLVGWITWLSGSQRIGMSTIIVLLCIGFLIMLTVPRADELDSGE